MPSCSVKYRSRYTLAVTALLLFLTSGLSAQETDYDHVFGDDWSRAQSFIKENEHWMRPALEEHGIEYAVAVAVIFPELVRYSALRDKMETTMLKTLYINLGEEYANFSVGRFQMKPSFAEKLREEAWETLGRKARRLFPLKHGGKRIKEYRASIVNDMEDPRRQTDYLIAFIKICEAKFSLPHDENKVRFLATAYNFDFDKTREEILVMQDAKYFTTKLFKGTTYSYSDISLYWYKWYIASVTY